MASYARSSKLLTIAGVGCGGRTRTYVELAAQQPERYLVVAAADPNSQRLSATARLSRNPAFRGFASADALFAAPRLADVLIIGTQDTLHREHAIRALEKGYDLLLEKPIATTLEDTLAVEAAARKYRRRVLVCHVLRYTPFFRKIKEIVSSGALGEIMSLGATEGVSAWHQAHSFVRGHWAVEEKASPMILAKSCHDLDIIRWVIGAPCHSVSSFGGLGFFNEEHAPPGAPARCMDGCPVGDTCMFNAQRYLEEHQIWLSYVCDLDPASDREAVAAWIHQSPWGRCVYRCGNTVVDHQSVNMRFDQNITATFTMSAFTTGRHLQIHGTRAQLIATLSEQSEGGEKLVLRPHDRRLPPTEYDLRLKSEDGYSGHGGGDAGLIDALHDEMHKADPDAMVSSLSVSIESHRIAFAAEVSRRTGETVHLDG